MVTWQKRARLLVLVVAVGVVAVVFFDDAPPRRAAAARAGRARRSRGGRRKLRRVPRAGQGREARPFSIEADKQCPIPMAASGSSASKVTSVRQGKTFVATGDEARVGENQTQPRHEGQRRMTASDGLEVSADSADYSQSEGIVRGSGSGDVQARPDERQRRRFQLRREPRPDRAVRSDATSRFGAETKGGDVTDITAGAAVLARRDKFVSFERAVHIVRGNQVIDADSALGDLTEDEEHLSAPRAPGRRAHRTRRMPQPGELKRMAGDVIKLTYYEDSDVLQSATITGGSSLTIAAEKGLPERCSTRNLSRSAWRPTAQR